MARPRSSVVLAGEGSVALSAGTRWPRRGGDRRVLRAGLVFVLFAGLFAATDCSRRETAEVEKARGNGGPDHAEDGAANTGGAGASGAGESAAVKGEGGAPPNATNGEAAAIGPVAAHEQDSGSAGGLPPGHPSAGGSGSIAPPPEGSGTGAAGLEWVAPATWKEEPPRSPMRRAQYRVPGLDGDPEDAECVVSYFGPGQGGSPESNAMRWVDQFRQPDGSSSQGHAKVEVRSVGGHEAMIVEVKGTFVPMAMPGAPPQEPKPGHAMLGAIVMGPDAPWFFKLTGPARTVAANRAAFESLIASVRTGS